MKCRNAVPFAVLLFLITATGAWAQSIGYLPSPNGVSYGASPSVLSLEIQTGYPRAIVRKNDWTAFQTSGTMRLYQDGVVIASAPQTAGAASVILPFSWNFTSGTRRFYAVTTTNPYVSGSVSVTAGYIPASPAGVTASPASTSSVTVKWNAVSGATRYKVRYTNTGAETGDLYSTTYTWPGLSAGTNHCFTVLACAGTGFCSAPSAQACSTTQAEQYRVGVLFYREKEENGVKRLMTWPEIDVELGKILYDVAANRPVRSGNGRQAQLILEMDVEWNKTELAAGQYDFEWFKEFARRCRLNNIKWTPLLSVHYAPSWIYSAYEPDRLRDMQGVIVPDNQNAFLKFSPSSAVWGAEAKAWVKAFVTAMKNAGHFGPGGAIDEVLIANEMMYPSAKLTSYDTASRNKWTAQYPTAPYPTSFYAANFPKFRADQLSYAIAAMIVGAKEVLPSNVNVSSKLYPFFFPRADDVESDEWRGYTDASIGYMNSQFRGIFALDSYPNSYCGYSWSPSSDYNAARKRTSLPLYVAEFNRNKGCPVALTRTQTYNAVMTGFQSYGVRTFIFFAWNPNGTDRDLAITPEQKAGLADAMNWIVP